jgi:hypothetical protein
MDMAQSDSGEIRPTDPDMHWTGWALDKLREIGLGRHAVVQLLQLGHPFRRQRREQATESVVKAVAQPDEAGDVERVRSMVWESLVEDEILDVQLDTLSPEDFLREVCRKIGRMPPSIPLPQGCDGGDTIGMPGPSVEFVATPAGDGWAEPPEESADGRRLSRLPKPDSS